MTPPPLHDALRGQKILVVGGAGFVGSNLVRALCKGDARSIVVVDNLLSSEATNIPQDARVRFVEGSIASEEVLNALDRDCDFVFHLATYHGNQSSIANPIEDHDNNLITTLKLLEWARSEKTIRKFVYAASGCVLAPHTRGSPAPVREEGPVPFEMDSPYQISKLVGEFYSVYYHRRHGVPTVRARFQNVYGPGEILGAGRWRGTPATVWRNVIPTFVYRALKGWPLKIEGDGTSSRDFIYVDDIVRGLLCCAVRGENGDVYNLASGRESSIVEAARVINSITGNTRPVEFIPRRAWDNAGRRVGSTEKARQVLQFTAIVGMVEGLEKTVKWTQEKLTRIQEAMDKHATAMERAGAPLNES